MPLYSIQGPDGKTYSIEGPPGATREQVIQAIQARMQEPAQTITAPPAPQPEQSGVLRQILDVPLQVARGGVGGIRMLADVFGAGSSASEALKSADTWLADLLSSQAKDDQRRIAEILKEAEDKGVLAQLGAGLRALATAPVDTLAQALGSTAPVIIAGLVSGPAGAALGLARAGAAGVGAARAGSVAMPAVGAAMGVGEVKGSIYEAVEQAYKEKGASDEVARAKALEAQSYASANLPSMAVAGGLGALAGGMGIERPLASILSRGAVRDVAEQQALREADRGLVSRVGLGALREGAPEFAQAGQSQLAQNLALINEGFDVPLFRNVFGAGAMEGAAGAILGGGLAIPRSGVERLPGQRDGESDSDFARRMSREIDAARRREQISPQTAPIAPGAPTVSTEDVYQFPDGTVGTMEQAKAYAMSVPVEQRQRVLADILSKRVPKEKTAPDLLTEPPVAPSGTVPSVPPVAGPPVGDGQQPTSVAPKIQALQGAETRLILPDGEKRQAKWEVIEADSVSAAMSEGRAQPRDRKRAASNAQVKAIAQNPDFDRLSDTSQTLDYGAPTLTSEYVIVGGNGRFEGINLSYDTEAGQLYKQNLVSNAQRFGIDPAQVSGMKKPILIRKIPAEFAKPEDTRTLAIQSNIVAGLEMSDMERAALDSERMTTLQQLDITDTGDIPLTTKNMATIRDALKGYTKEELSGMMAADGSLSQSGLRRVKNAILYKAYGKTDTLSRLLESPDADLKNVGTALMRASGSMSSLMDGIRSNAIPSDYDIVTDLTGAVETLSALRASGTKVQDFINQSDMFGGGISNEAKTILKFLDQNLRSAKSITEFLTGYANAAISAESAGGGLFGDTQLPSKQETIDRAAQRSEAERAAAKAQQTIFEQSAGAPATEGAAKPEGKGRPLEGDEGVTPSAPGLVEEIRKEMTPEGKPSVRAAPEQKELPPEIQAKVNALGKALKRILTRYGLGDVAVRLVEDMKAEGEYASKVLSLALDATDPVVALRHEAIHALKELGFFTPQQWKSLERQAEEKWVDQYLKQKNVNKEPLQEGQMSRYDAYMKLYGGNQEAIIEEAIADAFGDFSVKAPPGMLQAILKRLKNLFQGIKEAFGAEPEAERIFAKIERGQLRGRPEVSPEVEEEAKPSLREVPLSTRGLMEVQPIIAMQELGLRTESTPKPGGIELFNDVRSIAQALNRDTVINQGVIKEKDISTTSVRKIAKAIADEIAYQVKSTSKTGTGLGWYSNNYPRAVRKLANEFPELKTSEYARTVFSALVAITSNGEKVAINVKNAKKLYEQVRAGEEMIAPGSRRDDALENNLSQLKMLMAKHGKDLRAELMREITVKDMNAALRQMGQKADNSYLANATVPASAIYFGPKLGAFFANLEGAEGYLTMDLWWTRTINRMRGLLVPKATQNSINSFRVMMDQPNTTRDEVVAATIPLKQKYEQQNFVTELEFLVSERYRKAIERDFRGDEKRIAKELKKVSKEPSIKSPEFANWHKTAKRMAGPAYQQLLFEHKLEKLANTIHKNEYEMLEEAPFTGSDRQFMYRVAREAQRMLQQENVNLSLADIQGALWYYEKRLYQHLSGRKADDIGYDEAITQLAGESTGPAEPSVVFGGKPAGGAEPAGEGTEADRLGGVGKEAKPSLRDQTQTPAFKRWFGDSKVVDENGEPLVVYHGSPARDFTVFDLDKVNATDPDGPYNGFWFSSNEDEAATAGRFPWGRPNATNPQARAFYLSIKNPATRAQASRVAREIENDYEVRHPSARSLQDAVRLELQARGFDGVFHSPAAFPSKEEFDRTGEVRLKDGIRLVRGENGFVDYYAGDEYITDFESFEEAAKSLGAGTFVAFRPEQIKSATGNIGTFDPTNPDIRYSLRDKLGLYSELENKLGQGPNTAPAAQWKSYINALPQKGVKPEEIQWSGINDWLDLQGQPVPVYESGYGLMNEWQDTEGGKWTPVDDMGEYFRTKQEAEAAITDEMVQRQAKWAKEEGAKSRIVVTSFPGEELDFGKKMTPRISKEDILNYLKQGGVQVEEAVLGGRAPWRERMDLLESRGYRNLNANEREELQTLRDRFEQEGQTPEPENRQAKYTQYTLPGGENYREVLLTLPFKVDAKTQRLLDEERYLVLSPEEQATVDAAKKRAGIEYRSRHWDQPNVIAHIRVNDRTDADGNRVLFVEEIQSDWGQEGKKKGFRNDSANQKMFANESRIEDLDSQIRDINFRMRGLPDSRMDEFNALADERQKLYDEQQRLGEEINLLRDKAAGEIPPAPFVTKTEGWLNLALKRIMVMAAEGGYDKVAFVNGEQSADRYDLRKQVQKIEYSKNNNGYDIDIYGNEGTIIKHDEEVPVSELENLIGKEVTQKIVNGEGHNKNPLGGELPYKILSGLDLKVGGEGMKTFYDTIVPTAVKKLLPKVGGGQMSEVQIQIPGETNRIDRPRMESLQQPGFDVTPAMQDRVRTTGLPRFSLRDTVDVNGTPRPTTSSTGKPIYPTEEGTKNFWEWFGDSAVVDGEGRPLVVYHGTGEDFSVFKYNELKALGTWFASSPDLASQYAEIVSRGGKSPSVMPAYLSLKNPASEEDLEKATEQAETEKGRDFSKINNRRREILQSQGFDGVLLSDAFVVFKPEQIKSAIGNVGKFDRVNPNIKASLRGTINPAVFALADQITTPRDDRSFIRRIIDAISPKSASHFRAAFLDRYDILSKYEKELVKQMGGAPLLADISAHAAALMSDTSAGVLASAMGVHDGVGGIPVYNKGYTYVINNNNTVKGPIAIFAPLAKYNDPDIYRLYQTWAAVKRGIRLYGQGRPTGIIDPADQATIAALPPAMVKEFEDIQKEWIKFNDGLVKYLVDTGVLSVDQGKEFVKYSDYIPFYRQAEGEKTVGPQIFASLSGVRQPKKLKESETPIGEFLETVIRNVQYSIEAGMKNVAAQRSVKIAESIGMAQRLNYVSSAPNVVKVLENGQTKYYAAQDMLFVEAMKSLNLGDLPFIGLLAGPANLLRALVTKDPAFMLANMMRDSMSAWVSTGVNMTPMIDTLTNFTKALAGKNPEYAALLNSGVIGGYDYSQGLEASAARFNRELRKAAGVSSTGEKLAKPFTSLWDALEKGTTASDAATRMEIYKKTLAETGNEAEAVFRALEVMNFNRKGNNPLVRVLTAAVPFLNARMQGLDVLYRAAFAQGSGIDPAMVQKRFLVRGMTIAALSAMYWMLVHEDDEWKKQEQETRDNYWILGDVKIPIPFEIGVLFKVIPERILEYSFGNDTGKDFMKSMTRQLTNTLAFNPFPQTVLPALEFATNYSFFTQRPIVSQGLEDVAPAYQIAPGTSRIGELAGEATKGLPTSLQLSPVKVDALIRGYTGTIGGYMMDLFDAIYDMNSDAPKAAKRFEQMPVIRRFAVDPEARGQVTAYYELKNAVDEATRTANLLERNMNPKEWGEFMEQNMGLLATKDYVLDLEKSMKQYREMKNMVRASTMSADEKKDVLLDIIKLENQLASNIQEIKKMIAAQ